MTYWARDHKCAACQYWDGPRDVHSDSRVVECPAGARGTCTGPDSNYRGKDVEAGRYIGGERCFQLWYSLDE